MRLLAFYPYIPYPIDRGAYWRGFHLLRELARVHDVDLLALSENGEGLEHKPVFTEFCHRVELVPFNHPAWQKLWPNRLLNPLPATVAHWTCPDAARTLDRMLATERYDAVHLLDIILAQFFLHKHWRVPLVVDRTRVDLQYQLTERRRLDCGWKAKLLNSERLFKLWRYERRVAHRARFEIVCSRDDEAFVRRYIRRRGEIVVLPNGVDTGFFSPSIAPELARSEHPTILFCGARQWSM